MDCKGRTDYDSTKKVTGDIMPRVNWHLSLEAKAIFEAFKSEKGMGQDDAANAMILEFDRMMKYKKSSGNGWY